MAVSAFDGYTTGGADCTVAVFDLDGAGEKRTSLARYGAWNMEPIPWTSYREEIPCNSYLVELDLRQSLRAVWFAPSKFFIIHARPAWSGRPRSVNTVCCVGYHPPYTDFSRWIIRQQKTSDGAENGGVGTVWPRAFRNVSLDCGILFVV